MCTVKLIEKKQKKQHIHRGGYFCDGDNVYILVCINILWSAIKLENGLSWNGAHKTPEDAVQDLTPLGDVKISVEQI